MEALRAFIAIELEEALHKELAKVQSLLKEKIPPNQVRWVDPRNIHLTLKFLGQVPKARVPEVAAGLEKARQGIIPFSLAFAGLGCFPSQSNPRVIWVGCQTFDDSLNRLQAKIEEEMETLGFPRENRPFNPHLTLGRVKENARPTARRDMGEAIAATAVGELGRIGVEKITLMQSTLKPSGAEYTPLQHFSIKE